jgi:ribonuclease PH
MNVVATRGGLFVEVQGTAEAVPFARQRLEAMTDLAVRGIAMLTRKQIEVLGETL